MLSMAQVKQPFFHHDMEEEKPVEAVVYSESAYGVDGGGQCFETTKTVGYVAPHPENGNKEYLGELRTGPGGAYTLYEKHQGKMDQGQRQRNKIEEEITKAMKVGAGGYTFNGLQQRKEAKHEQKREEGKINRLYY